MNFDKNGKVLSEVVETAIGQERVDKAQAIAGISGRQP
jgi:hypothetical protein